MGSAHLNRIRLGAIAAMAMTPMVFSAAAPAAPVFQDDFNDGVLTDQWDVASSPANSSISIVDQQLEVLDNHSWGPGTKILSKNALDIGGGSVQFTFQLTNWKMNSNAMSISIGLENHILLGYVRSTNYDIVNLYIDQNGNGIDRQTNGQLDAGDRVWTSYPWGSYLVKQNEYLRVQVDSDGWKILSSTDGVNFGLLYTAPTTGATNTSSEGAFTQPLDMNFSDKAMVFDENGNGGSGGTSMTIDNLSYVPEPGSAALLMGLVAPALLRRKRA